jgi:hypothetical protein
MISTRLAAFLAVAFLGSSASAQAPPACQPSWLPIFGSAPGPNSPVMATAVFDDGNGSALYIGGQFGSVAGITAQHVARWDGTGWSAVGSGMFNSFGVTRVRALAVFDDGSGAGLYAAGSFQYASGVPANSIARWNGSAWSALGGGLQCSVYPFFADPISLAVFDDGSGPALYVSGEFDRADGIPVNGIARWNGSNWSAVGGNAGRGRLFVHDDGSGPALYSGSWLVERWNGTSWTTLATLGGWSATATSFATFDDGSGPALYMGGFFSSVGPVAANNIARWDGTNWSALGSGMAGPSFNTAVGALEVFDDGSGVALYAGGDFTSAGGIAANRIAKWDGVNWSALGAGLGSGSPSEFAVFDAGSGPALFVGGSFSGSPAGDRYLAQWGNAAGCGTPGVVVCEPGTGGVSACPCGNPPAGAGLGCNNSASTGGAQLAASGIARITYDSVVFTTSGERPSATSIVLQGDALNGGGALFGQGVRCVVGNLKRLYVKTASGGSIRAPSASDRHVHARSAALGDTIAPGSHRFYGVYYRDPNVLGGCQPTSTFNITQQLDLLWQS